MASLEIANVVRFVVFPISRAAYDEIELRVRTSGDPFPMHLEEEGIVAKGIDMSGFVLVIDETDFGAHPVDLRSIVNDMQGVPPLAPETDEAVDAFARALKSKLRLAQQKRADPLEWLKSTETQLSHALFDHLAKGDPIDVAAFAMFLFARSFKVSFHATENQTQI